MVLTKHPWSTSQRWMVCLGILSAIALLSACGQSSDTTNSENSSEASSSSSDASSTPSSTSETSDASSGSDPSATQAVTVTANSFGNAELCMTVDELQQAIPDLVVGPYEEQGPLVDTEGVTVTDAEGNFEFYALAVAGSGPQLNLFMTDNPKYQTAEGVGPKALIETAETQYGSAKLMYHLMNESREFVAFENGPENIGFRTGLGPEAGIYESEQEYNETEEYKPEAEIQEVWLVIPECRQ